MGHSEDHVIPDEKCRPEYFKATEGDAPKNAELRGPDSPFPVAVEPRPPKLSAYDFTSYTGDRSSDGVGIQFGMDQIQCAKVLREIADKIERREYILQSGRVMSSMHRDDFPMTMLRLVFYEGPPLENVPASPVAEG
jgi:hypothetical protein